MARRWRARVAAAGCWKRSTFPASPTNPRDPSPELKAAYPDGTTPFLVDGEVRLLESWANQRAIK